MEMVSNRIHVFDLEFDMSCMDTIHFIECLYFRFLCLFCFVRRVFANMSNMDGSKNFTIGNFCIIFKVVGEIPNPNPIVQVS